MCVRKLRPPPRPRRSSAGKCCAGPCRRLRLRSALRLWPGERPFRMDSGTSRAPPGVCAGQALQDTQREASETGINVYTIKDYKSKMSVFLVRFAAQHLEGQKRLFVAVCAFKAMQAMTILGNVETLLSMSRLTTKLSANHRCSTAYSTETAKSDKTECMPKHWTWTPSRNSMLHISIIEHVAIVCVLH